MRKLFLFFCLLLFCSVAHGQVSSQNARRQFSGTGVPTGACNPGPPWRSIYIRTTDNSEYQCTSAGVWTKVSSGSPFTGGAFTTPLLGPDGTAAAPTFSFSSSGNSDNGMFLSSANALGFSTAGVERWIINSSGALNPLVNNTYDIGNGTVNPRDVNVARSVISPLVIGGTANGATLTLQGSSGAAPAASYVLVNPQTVAGTSPAGVFIGAPSSNTLDSASVSDMLHVQGSDGKSARITVDSYFAFGSSFVMRQARGTQAAPTKTVSGDFILGINARGYQETTAAFTTANNVSINFLAAEDFTSTAQGTRINFYTTAIGSTTPLERLSISNVGITNLFKGADVVSAAAIVPTGNLFHVTGTTTITSITSTGIIAGTTITIIFDGVLTFTDGSNLKLAGNFVTTADDTITITYDGTNWYEVARTVN